MKDWTKNRFQCRFCDKWYSTTGVVNRHQRTLHSVPDLEVQYPRKTGQDMSKAKENSRKVSEFFDENECTRANQSSLRNRHQPDIG